MVHINWDACYTHHLDKKKSFKSFLSFNVTGNIYFCLSDLHKSWAIGWLNKRVHLLSKLELCEYLETWFRKNQFYSDVSRDIVMRRYNVSERFSCIFFKTKSLPLNVCLLVGASKPFVF